MQFAAMTVLSLFLFFYLHNAKTDEVFLVCNFARKVATVLSTSLGKMFFAWHFILNKDILF